MNATNDCPQQLQLAGGHLSAAADHADDVADRCAEDDGAIWSALAGQMRLVAAGLSQTAPTTAITPRPLGIQDHLDAALASLDQIAPLDGPPDLQLWAWRIVDLRAALTTMDRRP